MRGQVNYPLLRGRLRRAYMYRSGIHRNKFHKLRTILSRRTYL